MNLRKLVFGLFAVLFIAAIYLAYDACLVNKLHISDGIITELKGGISVVSRDKPKFSYDDLLSPAEKRWLSRNKDKLSIGPDLDFKPIEYINKEGEYKGIAADYIKLIESKLGLKFKIKSYSTWAENVQAAKNKEFDIWPAVAPTENKRKFMSFSKPYIKLNTVLIVSDVYLRNLTLDSITDQSVVVVEGYYTHDYLMKNYPNMNVIPVKSTLDALRRVSFKENDAVLCDIATALNLIESSGLSNLKIASIADVHYELSLAVRDDYPQLKSILEKALASVSFAEREYIYSKWINFNKVDSSLKIFFRRLLFGSVILVVVMIIFLVWNLSLRKLVKERTKDLEHSKNRLNVFKVMADNAIYGLVYADLEGNVIYSNETFANMHGMSVPEILGKNVTIFHNKRQLKDLNEIIETVTKNGELLNRELWHVKKDGTVFPTIMNFKVFDVAGNTYVSAAAIDISASKKTQELLVQSEKMMSLGGLAAGMAHEINNPLGAILQTMQNVQRRIDPSLEKNIEAAQECGVDIEKVLAYLNKRGITRFIAEVRKAGERAASLVLTMLQFAGDKSSKKNKEDIGLLIDKAIELAAHNYDLTFNFDFKHINLKKEYFNNDCFAEVIGIEIEQVVFNVLKNAAQALEENRDSITDPTITIKVSKKDQGVLVSVTDNGPGMPLETQKRVFEPFYTSKAPGVGTGLGLSISYFIIVENHGGKIEVDPSFVDGTRILIWLPTYSI